ncbi:acyltransferase family protein [Lachnospiraceae bacterium 62-35]
MEESRFCNKIHWFTFFFSLLVIWVHSANAETYLGWRDDTHFLFILQNYVGNVAAQVSVPGFFMISSYLFYRNFSMDRLIQKWTTRISTILVPFILWNFLYYMGYVLASRIPGLRDVVGKEIVPFNLMAAGDAILHYTYNYVFWYLYQLILLILLAPAIYFVVKRPWLAAVAGATILWAIGHGYRLVYLNLDALLYYGTAACFAVHEKGMVEKKWNCRRMAAGIFTAGIGMGCLWLSASGIRVVWLVLFRLLIPIALWLMTPEGKLPAAKSWMKDNFFLYAVHFAIVRLINKTGAEILPPTVAVPLILYIFMPLFCVSLSSLMAAVIKSYAPPVWRILTGGRNS